MKKTIQPIKESCSLALAILYPPIAFIALTLIAKGWDDNLKTTIGYLLSAASNIATTAGVIIALLAYKKWKNPAILEQNIKALSQLAALLNELNYELKNHKLTTELSIKPLIKLIQKNNTDDQIIESEALNNLIGRQDEKLKKMNNIAQKILSESMMPLVSEDLAKISKSTQTAITSAINEANNILGQLIYLEDPVIKEAFTYDETYIDIKINLMDQYSKSQEELSKAMMMTTELLNHIYSKSKDAEKIIK